MKLIIAIHPDPRNAEQIRAFVKREILNGNRAQFIYFPWAGLRKHRSLDNPFRELLKDPELREAMDRMHFLQTRLLASPGNGKIKKTEMRDFERYEESFNEALDKIKTGLEPGERVEAVSFGGCAHDCFKEINNAVMSRLKKEFGLPAIRGSRSKLKWVHTRLNARRTRA